MRKTRAPQENLIGMEATPWRPFFALIPRRAQGLWFWGRLERRITYRPKAEPFGLRWIGVEEFQERTR